MILVKLKNIIKGYPIESNLKKIRKQKKILKISSKKRKKNQANLGKPPKPSLIFKTCNLWNPEPVFNQETYLSTNLILKNKITEKILVKKLAKEKKTTKRMRIKIWQKKPKNDEIEF